VRCYRLCEPRFRALDGAGALKFGGRWNSPGYPVVYTSSTRALAALELLVHFGLDQAPEELLLLSIHIPDSILPDRISSDALPSRWQTESAFESCRRIGKDWLASAEQLALQVPSAVVPEEFNLLLNPRHPAFAEVGTASARPFTFDPRLLE
jgi:RES domain-containing protein